MREQEQALNVTVQNPATAAPDARNDGSFKMMGCSRDLIIVVFALAVFIQAYLLWHK